MKNPKTRKIKTGKTNKRSNKSIGGAALDITRETIPFLNGDRRQQYKDLTDFCNRNEKSRRIFREVLNEMLNKPEFERMIPFFGTYNPRATPGAIDSNTFFESIMYFASRSENRYYPDLYKNTRMYEELIMEMIDEIYSELFYFIFPQYLPGPASSTAHALPPRPASSTAHALPPPSMGEAGGAVGGGGTCYFNPGLPFCKGIAGTHTNRAMGGRLHTPLKRRRSKRMNEGIIFDKNAMREDIVHEIKLLNEQRTNILIRYRFLDTHIHTIEQNISRLKKETAYSEELETFHNDKKKTKKEKFKLNIRLFIIDSKLKKLHNQLSALH